jgi:hypothetical protein
LTYQQGKVSKGLAPLPLYAALNVKPTTSAKVFHGKVISIYQFTFQQDSLIKDEREVLN